MATSSCLESPLLRVPPAHPIACDHPAMEVKGVTAVTLGVWFRRRAPRWRRTSALIIIFIV